MTGVIDRMRPEILDLEGYSSARTSAGVDRSGFVRLDANESFESPVGDVSAGQNSNRYDSGERDALAARMADYYGVGLDQLLLTRGADEGIDLLVRTFCVAGQDKGLMCTPGFDYYRVALAVQGCETVKIPLGVSGEVDLNAIRAELADTLKIIFLCSPNNPTGLSLDGSQVEALLQAAPDTLVVLDEAYVEFSAKDSLVPFIGRYPNLVVLRTLSKAFGLAGARVGALIAAPELIEVAARVQAPYPLSVPSMKLALEAFSPVRMMRMRARIQEVRAERSRVAAALGSLSQVLEVTPSDANFLLVRVSDAPAFVAMARRAGVVLRDQSKQVDGGVRITIGSREENDLLLAALGVSAVVPAKPRQGAVTRKTGETEIIGRVDIDGGIDTRIDTGLGFFDHMIDQIARHSGVGVELFARGDLEVDVHHLVEDCMIVLGSALREALGDKRGLSRFGFEIPFEIPMDEASASIRLDLSGRPFLKFEGTFPEPMVGAFPVSMCEHAMRSIADSLGASLQVKLEGANSHHMVEACFKGFGRALGQAIRKDGEAMPSSKGMLA